MAEEEGAKIRKRRNNFCRRLENHIRTFYCNEKTFICGSLSELPLLYWMHTITDYDYIVYPTNSLAIPRNGGVSEGFRGKILIINTDDVHKGYARLIKLPYDENGKSKVENDALGEFECVASDVEENNRSVSQKPRGNQPENDLLQTWSPTNRNHGPAKQLAMNPLVDEIKRQFVMNIGSAVFNERNWSKLKDLIHIRNEFKHLKFSVNHVNSIKCPVWPLEAKEWTQRHRPSGWPTSDVVEQVINGGCHFVEKSHPSQLTDNTQWRFSFSLAEMILVGSWTDEQKYVYHILRLIRKKMARECGGEGKTKLCTYYFKTLMLWTSEKKSTEFWEDDQLATSIVELLATMIKWLTEIRCPNYFIPEYNMLESCSMTEAHRSTYIMRADIKRLRESMDRVKQFLADNPRRNLCLTCRMSVTLPDNCILYSQMALVRTNNDSTGNIQKSPFYAKLLHQEISDLVEGIYCHLQLTKNDAKNNHKTLSDEIEGFLRNAFYNDPGKISVVSFPLSARFVTDLLPSEYNDLVKITPLEDQHADCRIDCCNSSCRLSSRMKIAMLMSNIVSKAVRNKWTKSSKMCGAAFLANFYYVARDDPQRAYNTCRDALAGIGHFEVNINEFPVVLCSAWAGMFDEHLQVILGFISLLRSTKISDKTPWTMNICSECFIHYFEIQSLWKLVTRRRNSIIPRTCARRRFRSALDRFKTHRESLLTLNRYNDAGHCLLLIAVLNISSLKKKRISMNLSSTFFDN